MRHLHVWGCQAEVRICNPQENKLDERTISGFFICYLEKSKEYMFYCPTHSTRIVETGNARFIKIGETSGSEASQSMEIKEVRVQVLVASIVPYVVETHNNHEE